MSTEPSVNGGILHNIKSIQVAGDFQAQLGQTAWDYMNAPALTKAPHAEGEIWSYETPVDLKAGFYEYKYYVIFNDATEPPRWVSDPCTRYGGRENMNAGFVIGGSQPDDNVISPITGGRFPLRDLIIYEMESGFQFLSSNSAEFSSQTISMGNTINLIVVSCWKI
jgi:hypothetical protein